MNSVIITSNDVLCRVIVEDENEAAPMFDRAIYTGSVPENASPGRSVLLVCLHIASSYVFLLYCYNLYR